MSKPIHTDNLLSFQEYSPVHTAHTRDGSARIEVESTHNFMQTNSSNNDPMVDLMDTMTGSKMLNEASPDAPPPGSSFLSLNYYQKFFDVNTNDVVERIVNSMVPKRAPPSYLASTIEAKPDLYGPFWIQITLIFTIAISGNLAQYLQHASTPEQALKWRYDFHLVSYAATAIVFYSVFVPLALWGALKWSAKPIDPDGIEENIPMPSILALLCIYGYSLAIYVPVSILLSIQISLLQWLLVIVAAFLSGSVLVYTLLGPLRRTRHFYAIVSVVLAMHCILAAGFMLYFFHDSTRHAVEAVKVVVEATTKVAAKVVTKDHKPV